MSGQSPQQPSVQGGQERHNAQRMLHHVPQLPPYHMGVQQLVGQLQPPVIGQVQQSTQQPPVHVKCGHKYGDQDLHRPLHIRQLSPSPMSVQQLGGQLHLFGQIPQKPTVKGGQERRDHSLSVAYN